MSFVRIDVEDFYPTIDHEILLRTLRKKMRKPQLLHLVHSAIKTPTTSKTANEKGVPQGLSISNILSSIYLGKIDRRFAAKYAYFRYVDDILIICPTETAVSVFNEIAVALKKIGLTSHKLGDNGKSQISPVSDGVDYLGFHITPTKVSVRKSSYSRMIENILSVFTRHKSEKSDDRFIWRLNLKISGCIYRNKRFGWVFFFSQINDIAQLARLDQFITDQLLKRGQPQLRPRIKTFVRSYHEIRFNLEQTQYVPNLDSYGIDRIIWVLSQEEGDPEEHYRANFTQEEIRSRFTRLMNFQTRLERDLIETVSYK